MSPTSLRVLSDALVSVVPEQEALQIFAPPWKPLQLFHLVFCLLLLADECRIPDSGNFDKPRSTADCTFRVRDTILEALQGMLVLIQDLNYEIKPSH